MKKLVSEPDPRCSASTTRIVASIEAIVSAYDEYQRLDQRSSIPASAP
jgi:hypothetical protein